MGVASTRTEVVEMVVQMPTQKHEKKVRKALEKMRGVHSVEIYYPEQRVIVTGSVKPSKVLKEAKKVSKNADMWCYQYGSHYSVYAPFESIITPVFEEPDPDITSYYNSRYKHADSSYGHGHTSSYSHSRVLPYEYYEYDYGYDENATSCSVM